MNPSLGIVKEALRVDVNYLFAVYLFVENVRESASWYSRVLRQPLVIDEENFGLLKLGANELCFHKADCKSPLSMGGSVGYWKVDDLLDVAGRFVEHGGKIYRGPIEVPNTNEGICQVADPFGNVIGLQGAYSRN